MRLKRLGHGAPLVNDSHQPVDQTFSLGLGFSVWAPENFPKSKEDGRKLDKIKMKHIETQIKVSQNDGKRTRQSWHSTSFLTFFLQSWLVFAGCELPGKQVVVS